MDSACRARLWKKLLLDLPRDRELLLELPGPQVRGQANYENQRRCEKRQSSGSARDQISPQYPEMVTASVDEQDDLGDTELRFPFLTCLLPRRRSLGVGQIVLKGKRDDEHFIAGKGSAPRSGPPLESGYCLYSRTVNTAGGGTTAANENISLRVGKAKPADFRCILPLEFLNAVLQLIAVAGVFLAQPVLQKRHILGGRHGEVIWNESFFHVPIAKHGLS